MPDLYVSEFGLDPTTPTKGRPVTVRIGVYNKGTAPAGRFTVQWWAGEDYAAPAQSWTVDGLPARGGRILTYTYPGYPSQYAKLTTKVVVDSGNTVAESDEDNNTLRRDISVSQPPAAGAPDLYVQSLTLDPATPIQGRPVVITVRVYNKGTAPAGAYKVQWWPGENFASPPHEWTVDGSAAGGGRTLTYTYAGYQSWYPALTTKVVVDSGNTVAESDEDNNTLRRTISVSRR